MIHGCTIGVLSVPNWTRIEKNRNFLLACERVNQSKKVRDSDEPHGDVKVSDDIHPGKVFWVGFCYPQHKLYTKF